MRVRDEPGLRPHEAPRLDAQIKAKAQFRNPPVALYGGTAVALDREVTMLERFDRGVVDHGESSKGKGSGIRAPYDNGFAVRVTPVAYQAAVVSLLGNSPKPAGSGSDPGERRISP